MKLKDKDFKVITDEINKYERFVIISHRNPDADTIGANLALKDIITKKFHKKADSACADVIPVTLRFLKNSENIKQQISLKSYDAIISVDCSSKRQLKFTETIKNFDKYKIPIITIDHHASNNGFGKTNLIDADSSSTTEILYKYFEYLDFPVIPDIATCLLAGIYCDTGSFMHSNTSSENFQIAEKLMRKGANHKKIIKNMFQTKTVNQLKLWGKVFLNTRKNKKNTIVSKVTGDDFEKTNTNPRDLSGIINYLNSVPGSKMSILLSEDMKGNVKGSLRSGPGNVDVSYLCEQLGGGGHKKAAGFTLPGKIISEEVWKIESEVEQDND